MRGQQSAAARGERDVRHTVRGGVRTARLVMSDRQTGRDFKRTARSMDLGFGVCSNSLPTDVAFELRVLTASS